MSLPWTRFLPSDLPAARVAACFGLISDTHIPVRCPALPPAVKRVLQGVDLILHAGDVGRLWVLDRLSRIAPVVAVHGNDETRAAQRELPYQQLVTAAGRRVLLTHAHFPDRAAELASRLDDRWDPMLARRAAMGRRARAAIVVFGHLHVPLATRREEVLLVCPGALASGSYTTRQAVQTVALLFLRDDGDPFVTHVDLGAPEAPYAPAIDWDAGIRAALERYSASLLAPELAAGWPRGTALLAQAPPAATHAALRRAALPCWSGRRAQLTLADLVAELHAEQGISPALVAAFVQAVEQPP